MADGAGLVSVIIPVYNGERFIGRTLASALAQTYDHIEIIVVDDGSTDRTASIVTAAGARESRIRYFRRQNSGVAAARNFGVGQARGQLIAILDADDLWSPEKIARQVELLRTSSPEVGLVYCWALEIDEDDLIIPPVHKLQRKGTAHGRVTAELASGCFIESASTPLIKRSCIDAVGGFDPNLRPQGADDWKLYLAVSEICEFAVIPEYLVGYRQTSGSLSRDVTAMRQSIENVAAWIFAKRPDLPKALWRLAIYHANIFVAQRALDSRQFLAALRFRARAYRHHPAGLLKRSSLEFATLYFARTTGLRRASLRKRGWVARMTFAEFCAKRRVAPKP